MTEIIQAHLTTARDARAEGRRMDARNAYAQAAALSREGGHAMLQAHALRHLSDIDREAGQADAALAHAEQALALYRAHGGGEGADVPNSLRLKALALDALRRRDAAVTAWTEARDLYEAAGVAGGVAECEARLDAE
ncbi:MAG: tetratricopeptide repeat protein [Pseudomonadota bacterium]